MIDELTKEIPMPAWVLVLLACSTLTFNYYMMCWAARLKAKCLAIEEAWAANQDESRQELNNA